MATGKRSGKKTETKPETWFRLETKPVPTRYEFAITKHEFAITKDEFAITKDEFAITKDEFAITKDGFLHIKLQQSTCNYIAYATTNADKQI